MCATTTGVVLYNSNKVAEAKGEEMDNWIANDVFDKGQRYMFVRWIITKKVKAGRTYIKARLVVRGFEENTSEFEKRFTYMLKRSHKNPNNNSILNEVEMSFHRYKV